MIFGICADMIPTFKRGAQKDRSEQVIAGYGIFGVNTS
jgi:hypothetical protein